MFARAGKLGPLQRRVELTVQCRQPIAHAPALDVGIFGQHSLDRDTPALDDGGAERHAGAERQPLDPLRQRLGDAVVARRLEVEDVAAGDQLRQHHGRGLEGLDLLVGVAALGLVLYREHTQDAAGAQHRHPHERGVAFLARFRAIGELRMALGVGKRDRHRLRRDEADQPLTDHQPGVAHRVGPKPLGRKQFQNIARPAHIDRADLRDEFAGDQCRDPVETLLRSAGARHDVAQPA